MKNTSKILGTSNGWLYILIGCVWASSLLGLANAVVLRLPVINFIGPYMRDIITVLAALFALKAIIKRLRGVDYFFYVVFLCFYLLQYILYPENGEYIWEYLPKVFLASVPIYFVGCTLDIKKLDKMLWILSVLCIAFSVFDNIIYERASANQGSAIEAGQYSMGAAYSILPHVLYVCWYLLRKINIVNILFFAAGLFMLLSYGTRGPIVCLLVFFVIYAVIFNKSRYRWVFLAVVAGIGYLLLANIEVIMLVLNDVFSNLGLSTRITQQFLMDTLDDDSGRSSIISTLKLLMSNDGKMAYGIFGSYRYVNGYAHRIYWDFWFSYGYIFGTVLILALCWLYYRGVKNCTSDIERGFWLLLLCNSIVGLMFSDCYIFNRWFYLLLGYCISRIRHTELPELNLQNKRL